MRGDAVALVAPGDSGPKEGQAMFTKCAVLIPTDFSHYALYAMNYAIAMARAAGGKVHVVHVLDPSLFSMGGGHGMWLTKSDQDRLAESMREHAHQRLQHLAGTVRDAGVDAEYHIGRGIPAHEIISLAQSLDCGTIVMATHGRTGFDHLVFGSVAEHVVRDSPVPVLTIKHPEHECIDAADPSLRVERVLYPYDFTPYAEAGLSEAVTWCRELGAELVLLHAGEVPVTLPEFMPDAAAAMSADLERRARDGLALVRRGISGIEVTTRVALGVAYREVCRVATEENVDLLVMPTHTRQGLSDALHRSTAEKVVRLAPCPVLSLRVAAPVEVAASAAQPAAERSA
jgi:nucleotide-binding universal stress UspA family protein